MFETKRASPLDLPSGLPNNWPSSTAQDLEALPQRRVIVGSRQRFYFQPNSVGSATLSFWEFLSRFLWNELNPKVKLSNIYFLFVAVLQCIPQISNTEGIPTTLIPLLLVLTTDAIFHYMQEKKKLKIDDEANQAPASRYNYQLRRFVDVKASEIAVGDLLQVKVKTIIPADVVLFAVAENEDPPSGKCYVETRALDGETTLKPLRALGITFPIMQDIAIIDGLKGEIVMEHPNKFINSFHGMIDLGKFGRESIAWENVMFRGSVLRTTDWAIGVVVNTGGDCKVNMASNEPRNKISQVEVVTNMQVSRIIIALVILSFIGAIGSTFYKYDIYDAWYMRGNDSSPIPGQAAFFFLNIGYFFILHSSFVPISIPITLSIARHVQAYFMEQDLEMYHSMSDTQAQVNNCRLNEELGQISHVFCDKTGTLTRNMLDFRKASIGGEVYGTGITEVGRNVWKLQEKSIPTQILQDEERAQTVAVPHVAFYCPKYERDINQPMSSHKRAKIQQFFRCLGICHEVVIERSGNSPDFPGKESPLPQMSYSAPNPDDQCLVHAAAYFGFRLKDRKERFALIENRDRRNALDEVEVLETISFSSKRKMLSVVIKDTDGVIRIITKGADAALLPRLNPDTDDGDQIVEHTLEDVKKFSVEGLRCLLLAIRDIPAQKFYEWHKQYHEAKSDFHQQELQKAGKENNIETLEDIIESDLQLLGCVGMEDKLQYGSTECVKELTKAGINVWLMTGDKSESAQTIAISANLLLPQAYMRRVDFLREKIPITPELLATRLKSEIDMFDKELSEIGVINTKPRALLMEGTVLNMAIQHGASHNLNSLFIRMLQRVRAVIISRATPADKSGLVKFTRVYLPGSVTLAVGDGANDVSMIREAHVGVGISGNEGFQAAISGEFSFSQFRYLSPLILKHGHWNYVRTSNLICFTFYKNILMSMTMFWFNFNCAYTGQKIFTEGAIQLYNVFYTSFSILAYACYDHHISADSLYAFPQLYRCCISNEFFTNSVFWGWMCNSFFESFILSLLPVYLMGNYDSIQEVGLMAMFGCVFVVNAKMVYFQVQWYWWSFALLALQFALLVSTYLAIGALAWFDFSAYKLFEHICSNYSAWLVMLLQIVTIIGKDIYLMSLDRSFNFKPSHVAQELDAGLGKFKPNEVVPIYVPVEAPPDMSSAKSSPSERARASPFGGGGGGDGGGSTGGSSSKAKVSIVSLSRSSGVHEAKSPGRDDSEGSSPPSKGKSAFLQRVIASKKANEGREADAV